MKIGFYSNLTIRHNGSTQLRCLQPAEYLKSFGHDVRVCRIHQSIPRKGEVVILHRAFLDDYTKAFINCAKSQGSLVFYDTDDLLFEAEGSSYLVGIGKKNYKDHEQALAAMQACDHTIVSTGFLAERARKYLPQVSVLLNALGNDFVKVGEEIFEKRKAREEKEITIGYLCGSSTHNGDFKIVEQALLNVLKRHSNLKLILVGPLKFSKEFYRLGRQFEHYDFIPYADFANIFLKIDLNLVPLEQSELFCQAKSELKFIEAGICGVPSLVTPTAPYRNAIEDDVSSAFAEDNQWEQKIETLTSDKELLNEMGKVARASVLASYMPVQRAVEWQQLLAVEKPVLRTGFNERLARQKMLLRYSLQSLKRKLRKVKNG
jgi:glycosyltransferase involved in cell wall biosynthesis